MASGSKPIEVELREISADASVVVGERSFVLEQPSVGRIEIGSPPADSSVWQTSKGDFMHTVVFEDGGSRTEGGGATWDEPGLGWLASVPGSGDDKTSDGWIVVERVPSWCTRVILEYNERQYVQTPVRSTAVFPLPPGGRQFVRLFGVSDTNQVSAIGDFDLRL